jgi:hypothetical protein
MTARIPPTESDHVLAGVKATPFGWPPASLDPRLRARSPNDQRDAAGRKIHNLRSPRFQGIASPRARVSARSRSSRPVLARVWSKPADWAWCRVGEWVSTTRRSVPNTVARVS